ncbi:hypothetical protein ADZ37_17230 [Pannonibacter phragmitetus]|uniref:hypothetical protein n=1 Tax=Pannonibacter TaxID=227873 RepID=UPI00067AFD71|nr:hypothetical protein [Pannonibacter phragmitetus]KND17815.1 hypothetical protein ADZ37_17230 [Pannonibacter phragmitetus]MBA4207391.1 hypothetical protein [Polymorphum sp.]
MQLKDEVRVAVDEIIRNRFAGKVEDIKFEALEDDLGEELLLIRVMMSPDTTGKDFAGRFFGLTGLVRHALGEDMRNVFPIIRPVEAHA